MARLGYETALGTGWIVHDGDRVESILLPGVPAPPRDADEHPAPLWARRLADCLEAYFSGAADFVPGCRLVGDAGTTPLLKEIYRTVGSIRPGETMTYGQVAAAVGRPRAARAVGAAMAANPFPPVIPCHRVIGSDGRLHGYGGGLDMKAHLLDMEGARA